jgi:hypothetical protein
MFGYFFSWLILILSSSAFLIKGLGKGDRVMIILGIILTIFFLILHVVYEGKSKIKANFRMHIFILFFASLGSVLMAYLFHGQSFFITLYQQNALYFYFFYFLLHYLLPEPRKLERMLIIFGIIYCVFYIVQRVIYPNIITEAQIFWERGTLRIFMPGEIIMILAYFISFEKIFIKFEWLYLIHFLLSVVVALLLGTRMILFSLILLSLLNIVLNKRIKNKLAVVGLFVGVAIISFFAMHDTIVDMVSDTKHHADQSGNYVRVRAAVYFVTKLPQNKVMFVLGNGTPSERSPYGLMLAQVKTMFGFYLTDVGIIAIYVKFGLFFALTCFVIMFQCLFSKLPKEIVYIKYFMAYLLITMFTTTLPFEFSEGVFMLCIILYMIDFYKIKENATILPEIND